MDELSRDLMRGVGGLNAIEGAMDGDLTRWAQGEAVAQMADADEQMQARRSYSPPTPMIRPGACLALIAAIAVILLIAAAFH